MGAYLDSSTARHSACARILSLSQCLSIDFIFSEVAMDLLLIQRTGWSDSLGQNIFFPADISPPVCHSPFPPFYFFSSAPFILFFSIYLVLFL